MRFVDRALQRNIVAAEQYLDVTTGATAEEEAAERSFINCFCRGRESGDPKAVVEVARKVNRCGRSFPENVAGAGISR